MNRDHPIEVERQAYMGERADGHCPHDEAQLRVDKSNAGFICPICWTHFDIIEEQPHDH